MLTHAERIQAAVGRAEVFASVQDENDADTRLVDMLTDLRHWAREHGADWSYGLRMSATHAEAEREGRDI